MALTVLVRSGELATPASITFDAPRIVLGRGDGCEVLLPDPSVSQRHASIRQRGTDYVVMDEGSTNGTFVGPVRLSPHAPRVLQSGDLLRIGRIWLEVRIEQAQVTGSQMNATREIALALVAGSLAAEGETPGARVRVQKGPDPSATLVLTERDTSIVIGRGASVQLSIEDDDISRRHAEITRRGLTLVVRDLGSKNGTLLDGKPLQPGTDSVWRPLSVLLVGQTELVYEDPVRAALEAIESLPDEHMRDSDPIEPPAGVPVPEFIETRAEEDPEPVSPVRQPSKQGATQGRRPSTGLSLLDFVIGLIALLVLGVSLLGLWLLFRT